MTGKFPLARIATSALLSAVPFLFAVAAVAYAQEAGTLRIAPEKWRFHTGDDPRCAAINDSGCNWQPPPRDAFGGDKYYWKRAEVELPDDLRRSSQLGLLAGDKLLAFEVYANGHLIGGTRSEERRVGKE